MESKETLEVALIQTYLHWEDKEKNLKRMEGHLQTLDSSVDIAVLPEMFSTAFTMNSSLSETMNGPTVQWMIKMAKQYSIALCGSVIIEEKNKVYNRFLFVEPTGKISNYDKRHTFRMSNEHLNFSSGSSRTIINYLGWKIFPQICYDLRFPVYSRNRVLEDEYEYDLMIYVANWPERRNNAWKALLPARAVENQSYLIAVNRIGMDGNGVNFTGDSGVLGVLGDNILPFVAEEEQVKTISLSLNWLKEFRRNFPVWKDADTFELK